MASNKFVVRLRLRITKADNKRILKIVKSNQDLFFNLSHFVRASVLQKMREFDEKGKRRAICPVKN